MTKPRTTQISLNYDQMQALWSRYGSSVFANRSASDEMEIAFMIRGKAANRMQHFTYWDGEGNPVARITRFWFEDETTDDLVFLFRWTGIEYVLSDW
jgi:hypothetical protein